MITTAEKVLFLKGIELFSAIPSADLVGVALVTEEVEHRAGEVLMREGEIANTLYLILEGTVIVTKGERVLAELGEREVVGEMALLDAAPRSATVSAATDVSTLELHRDPFEQIMSDRPEIGRGIIKVLTQRLRTSSALTPEAVERRSTVG
ncbi:MAG: cyclic nucleotide-binding domain-containing protein [Labilithrix sp.]|nr:cyclic nucleotide-binding domain-containing protein [Labilithrix sp.]MCW5811465.1 cyclic nucleotide-binding domain-containing protein [Labilithrix sp.]